MEEEAEEEENKDIFQTTTTTTQESKTIIISRDSINNVLQSNPSNSKNIYSNKENDRPFNSLKVFLNLTRFQESDEFQQEMEHIKNAINAEFIIIKQNKLLASQQHQQHQWAWIDCLHQLSSSKLQHLNISFLNILTLDIDLHALGRSLKRLKHLSSLSLNLSSVITSRFDFTLITSAISEMANLRELSILTQYSLTKPELQNLSSAISKLAVLVQFTYGYNKQSNHEYVTPLFVGIKCLLQLQYLDIAVDIPGYELVSAEEMFRNLRNLERLKLKLTVLGHVYDDILQSLLESIFGIQSLHEIDFETNLVRCDSHVKLQVFLQNIYCKLCNLEVLRLKTFEVEDRATENTSQLRKIFDLSTGISKIINLKKVELKIYRRNTSNQKDINGSAGCYLDDQPLEIAKNIRLLQGINELILIIGERNYQIVQSAKKKTKKHKVLSQQCEGDRDNNNNTYETSKDLLSAISSLKKLEKINLTFENGNYIGDEGWEEFKKLQNLKELRISILQAVSISSTALNSLSSVFNHKGLQVFSFVLGDYSNASSNGWSQFFASLGKLADIQILELKIGKFNQLNRSVEEIGQAIRKMMCLRELFVFLDGSNNVAEESIYAIGNALEQLRSLRIVRIVDKNRRDNHNKAGDGEVKKVVLKKNKLAFSEFNKQWKSLRNLTNLEEITIDYDAGQSMSFQEMLELSQSIVDMERLREFDLDVVTGNNHRMIGQKVTGLLNKKQVYDSKRIAKYPSHCKYFPADKDDEYCEYDSSIRFKTINGMVFGYQYVENTFNIQISRNDLFSYKFKDLSALPMNISQLMVLLVERDSKQLSLNLKDLSASLMNFSSCRKLVLILDGFQLPQEQFESIIASLYAMTNLQSLCLRFSTNQLSEDITQDLTVIQLQLKKIKLYLKLDPFMNQSYASMILIKSLISNHDLQKVDIQLQSFAEIYLQIKRKCNTQGNVIVIDSSSEDEEDDNFERILEVHLTEYAIPEDDEFILNLSSLFDAEECQNVFSQIILNIQQEILLNEYEEKNNDEELSEIEQTPFYDLFCSLRQQQELRIFKLNISSINLIPADDIQLLASSIGYMDKLIELELKLHSDQSFSISKAISIIPEILDIPAFSLEIKGSNIVLANASYPPENVILFLNDQKIAISKRSTTANEDIEQTIKRSQSSELFRYLNKVEKLTAMYMDMTCFKNNKNYNWEKFKHLQSLFSLSLTANYPGMAAQLQGMFAVFSKSSDLRILHLKVFVNINENIEMFGGELQKLSNITQLKIHLIGKQQQEIQKQVLGSIDEIEVKDNSLCYSIQGMLNLEQVSIQIDEKSQVSAQYLTNLTSSLLNLPKLHSLMLSLSVIEHPGSLISCLHNLKALRQHSQLNQTDITIKYYFFLGFKSIDLEQSFDLSYPLLEKKTILFSYKELFYEISLPDCEEQEENYENQEEFERQKYRELLRAIYSVWEEGIDKMVIIIEDYKYFRRSIQFLKELVVFLQETNKILPFLRLSLKALEQNQLLELCETALRDKRTINVDTLKIFFLHGSIATFEWLFDEFMMFFEQIVGQLQKTRTLILSTIFDGKSIQNLSNLAKRKLKRLVNLNTGRVSL